MSGTYQFGAPRLKDLGVYTPGERREPGRLVEDAGDRPGQMDRHVQHPGLPGREDAGGFQGSPNAQKGGLRLHQQRTDQEIDNLGLGSTSGRPSAACRSRATAARHGASRRRERHARRLLRAAGPYNPADANGTTLLDYARLGDPSRARRITGSRAGLIALGMLKKDMTQDLARRSRTCSTRSTRPSFRRWTRSARSARRCICSATRSRSGRSPRWRRRPNTARSS
jgi:hypothetical protein